MKRLLVAMGFLGGSLLLIWYLSRVAKDSFLENKALGAFVSKRLPHPVVFTSRNNLSAFEAAPAEGMGLKYPGQGEFQAAGKLRLLTPDGRVLELTWNRALPDGTTLVDALSPSISPDGKRVLFAGRKSHPSHGRFRIFEITLSDYSIRQITGLEGDPGCGRLPPMRHDAAGALLPDPVRMKTDFDDIDPIELAGEERTLVFASSREPDLGRDHSRRSFQIWRWEKNSQVPVPMTANRNTDRWPWQLSSNLVAFSMWSRNREVVAGDGSEIIPFSAGDSQLTRPTDQWQAMFLHPMGEQFGLLAKGRFSLFRPRALENGDLAFMAKGEPDKGIRYRVGVCPPGWVGAAPSAHPGDSQVPATPSPARFFPTIHQDGKTIQLATPSPFPGNAMLLAASLDETVGAYALALASANQVEQEFPATVFDDPDLADGEPVVVLPRVIQLPGVVKTQKMTPPPGQETHGLIFATGLNYSAMGDLPGQKTDAGSGPVFPPPPSGLIQELRVYASPRDRFDHPDQPRVIGGFSLVSRLKVNSETANGWVPSGEPTVLAGFDARGKVASWLSQAKDSRSVVNHTLGFAGDHYSLVGKGRRHFCVGCHPGHSGLAPNDHKHHEKWFNGP